MKKFFIIISLALIFFILGFSVYLKSQYRVPILMYHSLDTEDAKVSKKAVSPENFSRQMAFLSRHKYKVISLEELISLIKEKKKIPKKSVVITFDDGHDNNFTYGFPVLKKYQFPAIIFVIVSEIGKPNFLSWHQLKEMLTSGIITIGSHSFSHKDLSKILNNKELEREIFTSKKILEEKLGTQIDFFCYPYGAFSGKVKEMVKNAGYKAAVTTKSQNNYPENDIYTLKRIRISNSDNLLAFWVKTSGFYNVFRRKR